MEIKPEVQTDKTFQSIIVDIFLPISFNVCSGLFQQFWEKAPGQNCEKNDRLHIKINDIEHNKGSKIYPQNQVIIDCIMPNILL